MLWLSEKLRLLCELEIVSVSVVVRVGLGVAVGGGVIVSVAVSDAVGGDCDRERDSLKDEV
jgi:hypothetical protein